MNQFLRIVLLSIITITAPLASLAQTLKFFDVDKSQFPIMKAKFYAFDASNISVSPPIQALTIRENGKSMPILSVVCTPEPEPPALSSVIMVDISGSMSNLYSTYSGLDLAKTAAKSWINGLPQGLSEAAIGSFNDDNYINSDFTTNRQTLLSTLSTLSPFGGTDYNKGLLEPFAGALQLTKNAKYQKIIIYITDGLPNFEPNVQTIVQEAKNQECVIFAITLGLPCPTSLREITAQTGGKFFENVTTLQEAETLYLSMLKTSQLAEPCEIVWRSSPKCEEITQITNLEWNGISQNSSYTIDASLLSTLEYTPPKILFNVSSSVGQPHDTTITVKAVMNGFSVKNITSSEPSFEIFPKQFTLKAGESTTLTVRYTPKDSSYYWSEFTFDTDVCPQSYYAAGKFNTKKPIPQKSTIQLSYPNGEEILAAGSDTKIRWNGIPATDQVMLELSNDNAATWAPIEISKSGLEYLWRVPKISGSQYRVRVSQTLEKPTEDAKDVVYCQGHIECIRKVVWSPDGSKVLTAGMDGKAIVWNALDGSIVHTLSSDYSAITICDWSPDGKYIVTAGIDDSVFVWDAATGTKRSTLHVYIDAVTISWNHSGSTMLLCGKDGTLILWYPLADTYSRYSVLSGGNWIDYAQWSPDDQSIVLCTENLNSAIVWDAILFKEKLRLKGHTKNVRHAAWSPDGKLIATAGGDNLIKISEASTGKVLTTLLGHSQVVSEVAWSPDGLYVASASDDLTSCIWDPFSGNRIQELLGHTGILTHLEWNRNGRQLATSSGDNTAIVWDVTTGSIEKKVTQKGYLTYVAWSPNGKRLVTSGCDFKAAIWNIAPAFIPYQMDMSDTVFSIVAPTPMAFDVDMGQLSVGSSKDTVVKEYLINTGTYPFRVDSIRIAGGIDSSEFTLVPQQYPFNIAVGESRFGEFLFHPTSKGMKTAQIHIFTQAEELVKTITGEGIVDSIEIQGVPLGFGKVDVGTEKDVQQGYVLMNHSAAPVEVFISETGPNMIDYSIINEKMNFTLNPGDRVPIDVRFAPKELGRTGGGLKFDFSGKRAPAMMQLFGEGVPNSPLLAMAYSVNMGKVPQGDIRDSIGVVMVKNKSTASITIASVEVKGSNPEDFKVLSNGLLTIDAQVILALDIRFSPKSTGNKYAEIVLTPPGGGAPISVTVMGKGIVGVDNSQPSTATIRVGSTSAQTGDTIGIPLLITASKNLPASKAVELRGFFHCRAASLMPVGTTPAAITQDGISTFAFSSPINHSQDTQIVFTFRVLSSMDSVTEVSVDSMISIKGKVAISTENGTFRLLPNHHDTSGTGGKDTTVGGKTGSTTESIQLGPLAPNPTGTTADLTIRLIEKGKTLLQLMDITGRIIKTLIHQELPAGMSNVHLDVSDVATGKYYIILETPTQKRTLPIEILR